MNMIDIEAFDAVADSESGHDIEMKQADGITGTGVYFTIIGRNADAVVKWISREVNKAAREQQMAERRGKTVDPTPLEEVKLKNMEGAAIRVTGWRNVQQAFSPELLRKVLTRNPHWVDQIIEASNDMGNFPQKQ